MRSPLGSPVSRARRRLGAVLGLALAGAALAACSSGPATLSGQVQSWESNAGYAADVAQIKSDLGSLAAGLRARQLLDLRTECEGFGDDVEALYGELPAPDRTATTELGNALPALYSASRDCFDSSSFDSTSFRTYQRLLKANVALYDRALNRLAADVNS